MHSTFPRSAKNYLFPLFSAALAPVDRAETWKKVILALRGNVLRVIVSTPKRREIGLGPRLLLINNR